MKTKLLCLVVILPWALLLIGAVTVRTDGIYIQNLTDTDSKFLARGSATQSAPWLEFYKGGTTVFSISAGGGITCPGIQSGTIVTAANGTVTNIFSTVFSSPPVVTVTQTGATLTVTNSITSITASNFVLNCGAPNITNGWIAIGAP